MDRRVGDHAPGPLPAGRPRDELVAEVQRSLRSLPQGAAVLVAVSGGPDSTALAFLTAEARPDLQLALGHVRHGLRPDEDDVALVREHASFLGAPLAVSEVTIVPRGEGLEAAARAQRYAALRRQARAAGAGWILLGHTADDQAETLLLRLARGTGVPGLGGMSPVRGDLLRPLLRLRRSDVHRFVLHEGLRVVADPMNSDRRIRRIAAREVVLPAFEELGPDPVGALCRLADLAREDARKLDHDAGAVARRLVRRYGSAAAIRDEDLAGLDGAIASRIVRDMVAGARGTDEPPTAAQVSEVLGLASGTVAELPGLTVSRGGGWLAFAPEDTLSARHVPVEVPGRTPWPLTGATVVTALAGDSGEPQLTLDVGAAWVPPRVDVPDDAVPPGGDPEAGSLVLGPVGGSWNARHRLVLRTRRAGDRVRTAGGTRKLQDVLVDAGVPRVVRDLVPLLVLGDRVLWVPGVVADEEAVAAGREAPLVHLHVTTSRSPRE